MRSLKKMLEKSASWAGILILGVVLGLTVKMVGAWVEPSSMPPGGNIAAPLNTGSIGQSKKGGLTLNIGGATYGLIVSKGLVGIKTTSPQADLDVNGDIRAHNLQLNGNLNVNGNSNIKGTLNVTNINVKNINVNGKPIGGGFTPQLTIKACTMGFAQQTECTATCPSGYLATGGGYDFGGFNLGGHFSVPKGNNAWRCGAWVWSCTGNCTGACYVTCLKAN